MKRLQRLKKSLSLLLTFSMIISLFYGVVPAASAVDGTGTYVTVQYGHGLINEQNLTVVVKDPDGKTVDTVEITDAKTAAHDISVSLNVDWRDTYDIKRVEKSGGGTIVAENIGTDDYSGNWQPWSGDTTVLTIYLCKPLTDAEKPVVDGDVQSGMYYRAYEPQLLKMLYVSGQITSADGVAIDDVSMEFVRDVEGEGSRDLNKVDSPAYYCPTGAAGLVEYKLDTDPYNIAQLRITYTVNGAQSVAVIPASQLRYVQNGDVYEIQSRDDSIHEVSFYADGVSFRLHAVRFVKDGDKLGEANMPADPELGLEYVFVSWDLNRDGGSPFDPNMPITEDTKVYSQKLISSASGTEFHVMNRGDELLERIVEMYNANTTEENQITVADIDKESVDVVVTGEGKETNSDKLIYGWEDDYFLVSNTTIGNTHINPTKVEVMRVTFEVNGRPGEITVSFERGYAADQFQVTIPGVDNVAETIFNSDPHKLTEDEAEEILKQNAVTVACGTAQSGHAPETYGLKEGSFAISGYQYTKDGYVCVITVSPDEYVKAYAPDGVTHSNATPASQTITMRYTADREWVPETTTPVTFTVECEPQPIPGYTLTYNANNGYWGTKDVQEQKETGLPTAADENGWHTLIYSDAATAPTHDLVSVEGKDVKVLFVGWTLDDTKLDILTKDTPKNQIPVISASVNMGNGDRKVYAVWAEDRNDNGKPDYQEEPITVTFDLNGGTTQGTTAFTLNPFPEGNDTQVGQAPAVTAPQDQTFVNWTLQGDTSKTLSDGEYFTYDSMFKMADGKTTLVFEANYQYQGTITITPASMTVYMGGHGYTGVVKDEDTGEIVTEEENGFPVPGFVIELPAELKGNFDVKNLRLKYDGNPLAENEAERLDYTWEFVPYDDNSDHEVYFIKPVEGTAERSVRIQFTSTVTGDVFTSDTFEAGRNINQELKMEVYGEGIDAHKVYFTYDGKQYNVGVGEATLTVRGTSSEVKFSNDDQITTEHPKFEAAEGTTYTINGSEIQVTDSTGVALLFDEILDTVGTTDRSDLLENRAEVYFEQKGITADEGNTFDYQLKYLDLVDTNNGNAWVVADQPVTISWPVPDGVDASTVRILHYKGVDRSSAEENIANIINGCTVEDMKAVVADGYATFTVEPGNFSPFAMVWETKDTAPTNNKLTYHAVARQFFCETRTEFLRKNSPVLRSKSETRSLASTAPKMEGAVHVKGRVLAWGGAAFAAPPLAFCPWGSSYPSVASPASSAASWAATGSVYSDQP